MQSATCGKTTFSYNGDLSGDVIIRDHEMREMSVPGGDLIAFVAEYVRAQRISKIEDMDALTVLGVPRL